MARARSMAAGILAFISELVSSIEADGMTDPRAKFIRIQSRRYLAAYGRSHFETAAVYGRRLAEGFCWYALPPGHPARYEGLCAMSWALDFWDMYVSDFVRDHTDIGRIASHLGMGLTTWRIFDDVTIMRRYGNMGAHFDEYALHADPEAFTATLRIIVASIVLFRHLPPVSNL